MSSAGRKLFQIENIGFRPKQYFYLFSTSEVMHMNSEKDRLLLENIARNAPGTKQKAALRQLAITEPPPPNPLFIADETFDEEYWVLFEQISQISEMADCELLRTAAFASCGIVGTFAFCRMTGYHYPPPECDAYSHRVYDCGRIEWMTDVDVCGLCREMVAQRGPFAREAAEHIRALSKGGGSS